MLQINLAFFITTVIMGMVMVPFVMFYYEGVDDSDDESDSTYVRMCFTIQQCLIYANKWY
jgi:LMBR1 domain-containing protein 1